MLFHANTKNLPTCYKNENFITWPGLTTSNLLYFLTPSIDTALEHIYQEQKTTINHSIKTINIEEIQNSITSPDLPNTKLYDVCALIVKFKIK